MEGVEVAGILARLEPHDGRAKTQEATSNAAAASDFRFSRASF